MDDHFLERHELVSISIGEKISIDKAVYQHEMKRLRRLRSEAEQLFSADTPMSTNSDWIYPSQIVDFERSMFERSMFSVSPLPFGMRGEDVRRAGPPPLSHSPDAGASPMQPGTPANEPGGSWAIPPIDGQGEKEEDQQRTAVGEASNEAVQSPSNSPSQHNSLMEWISEFQEQ
jgi:hypothetical protein